MKKKSIYVFALLSISGIWACKNGDNAQNDPPFAFEAHLDSLKNGSINYGSQDANQAAIRLLNFQKKFKTGEQVGTVIPKSYLTQAVNGFTGTGINMPIDTANYSKWDFLVVYPGIASNAQGEEKAESSVFFYKGGLDGSGNFIPVGKPVLNVKFRGGGGGPGDALLVVPPPRTP
jgi:hypothetical protein